MSARVKRSVTRRRHREVQSSGLLLTWDGEEGGKRRREGGKAAGRAGVTDIWRGGGGIPSFTPHVLLYSRRPSEHISASPARLSQTSYPVALPFTFDVYFVAVSLFRTF